MQECLKLNKGGGTQPELWRRGSSLPSATGWALTTVRQRSKFSSWVVTAWRWYFSSLESSSCQIQSARQHSFLKNKQSLPNVKKTTNKHKNFMLSYPCPPALQLSSGSLLKSWQQRHWALPCPDAADVPLPRRGWASADGTSHQSPSDTPFTAFQEMAWESSQKKALWGARRRCWSHSRLQAGEDQGVCDQIPAQGTSVGCSRPLHRWTYHCPFSQPVLVFDQIAVTRASQKRSRNFSCCRA